MTLPWPSSSHAPSTPLLASNQSTSAYPSPLKSPTPTTCHGGEHPEPQVRERTSAFVPPFERSRVVAINDATNNGRRTSLNVSACFVIVALQLPRSTRDVLRRKPRRICAARWPTPG